MTDLWTEATRDAEAEEMSRQVTAARVSAVDVWPFLAGAEDERDYVNRKAIVADRLDQIVSTLLPNDPVGFGVVRSSLEASFDEDYQVIAAQRAEETQARQRIEATLAAQREEEAARARVEATLKQRQAYVSTEVLQSIQRADPDGGTREPTEADYAAFKSWVISQFGKEAWEAYHGNWGTSYEATKTAASDTGTCGTCGRATSYDKDTRKWTHDNEGPDTQHAVTKASAKTASDDLSDEDLRALVAEQAALSAEFSKALAALREAGVEYDADHPAAQAYRAASDAVNHVNRKLDYYIATGRVIGKPGEPYAVAARRTAAFPEQQAQQPAEQPEQAAPKAVERRVDQDPDTGEFVGSEWVEKEGDPNTLVQSDTTFNKNPRFKTEEEANGWQAETSSEEQPEEAEESADKGENEADTTKPDAGKPSGANPFEKKDAAKTAATDEQQMYEWGYAIGERVRNGEQEPVGGPTGEWKNSDGSPIDWQNSDKAFPRGFRDGMEGKPKQASRGRHPFAERTASWETDPDFLAGLERLRTSDDHSALLEMIDQNARLRQMMEGRPDYADNVKQLHRQDEVAKERLRQLQGSRTARGGRQKVFEESSADQSEAGDGPTAADLNPLVGKYVEIVFYNEHGVGADYEMGRITEVYAQADGNVEFEWKSDAAEASYPVSGYDVYRITRLEEPTDPGQMSLFSRKTASSEDYDKGYALGKRHLEKGLPYSLPFGLHIDGVRGYQDGYEGREHGQGREARRTASSPFHDGTADWDLFRVEVDDEGMSGYVITDPVTGQDEWLSDEGAANLLDALNGHAPPTELSQRLQDAFPDHLGSRRTAETHAPYRIEPDGDKWKVVNDIGETKGTHDTKEQAREHQKALYANVEGASEQAEKKSSARTAVVEKGKEVTFRGKTYVSTGEPATQMNEGNHPQPGTMFHLKGDPEFRMAISDADLAKSSARTATADLKVGDPVWFKRGWMQAAFDGIVAAVTPGGYEVQGIPNGGRISITREALDRGDWTLRPRTAAANPYSVAGNPYVAPMVTPGTPDDILDGPADINPPVLDMPMTTRPRQRPNAGQAIDADAPVEPENNNVTQPRRNDT